MLNWLKKLRHIVASYDSTLRSLRGQINRAELLIRERTEAAVDIGYHGGNHVIVIGSYRGADYIQSYTVSTHDFASFIEHLKAQSRYQRISRVDAPPEFRAVIKREGL